MLVTLSVVGVKARDTDRAGHPRYLPGIDDAVEIHETALDLSITRCLTWNSMLESAGSTRQTPFVLSSCSLRSQTFPYSFREVEMEGSAGSRVQQPHISRSRLSLVRHGRLPSSMYPPSAGREEAAMASRDVFRERRTSKLAGPAPHRSRAATSLVAQTSVFCRQVRRLTSGLDCSTTLVIGASSRTTGVQLDSERHGRPGDPSRSPSALRAVVLRSLQCALTAAPREAKARLFPLTSTERA